MIASWRVAAGVGLLLVGLGVGLILGSRLGRGPAATAPVRVTSGGVGPGGPPFEARVPDAAGPVRAAVGFVAVWARPRDGWHEAVRALVTPELGTALDATDPGSLPDADPTGAPQVRSLAEGSAMVAVPLSTGHTVVVTVVAEGGAWLVNDVQSDAGNS
jgi:hypothetical protein